MKFGRHAVPRRLQEVRLLALSLRDMLASAGPILLLVALLLAAAYWLLQPEPPRRVRLATGPPGSAYANFGQRYQRALAAYHIDVELLPTEGSQANLELLRHGGADLAFVRGGSADPVADARAGLTSLGALFYEPLWIFYRTDAARRAGASKETKINPKGGPLRSLAQFKGLRLNIDRPGSGVPEVAQRMLALNHLEAGDVAISQLDPAAAADRLLAGTLDAVVIASAPQSPLVQRLLRAPGIALLEFEQNDAYARRFGFLSPVALPRGIVDLAADQPPHDVPLVAATTSLLSREETHPALRQLFAQASQTLHGEAGWFHRARDFPNTRTSELPVSPEGDRAINGTPPVWQRWLPFWASNLLERMWLVIGGLLVLLLPLSRVVPPLYQFRVRRRVFRWYARLRELEAEAEGGRADPRELVAALDALDRTVNRVAVPLSVADELYALRRNIRGVRDQVQAQAPAAGGSAG